MSTKKSLLFFALLNRLLILFLGFFMHNITRDYDLSNSNSTFIKWDSVYFVDIAKNGYTFENELAFFPGFPLLIRFIYKITFGIVSIQIISQIIPSIFYVLNCLVLYDLTISVGFSQQSAYRTSLFWCISPISIFTFAPYTESLFSFLSFFGMLMTTKNHYFISFISFFLASGVRSNGFISAGFLFYEILKTMISFSSYPNSNLYTSFLRSLLTLKPKFSMKSLVLFVFGCLLFVPSILFSAYSTREFCPGAEWCGKGHYQYVQSKYWGVGFLKYWRPQQIPNIALAFPICCFCLSFVWKSKTRKILKHSHTLYICCS